MTQLRALLASCLVLIVSTIPGFAARDTIKLATFSANYRVALMEIAKRYEKEHPDVTVEVTIVPQNFETWIRTRFAAGGDQLPDIYNANYTVGYERMGKLVNLWPFLQQTNPYTGKRWYDMFYTEQLERFKLGGELYSVPIDTIEIAMFYNRDIFDRLKLQKPKTWSELLDTCRKIKKAGLAPIAIGGNATSFWAGDMGWLVRMFSDVYTRKFVPQIVAQPGDWDYDATRCKGFKYDGQNPMNDLMVVMDNERLQNCILDKSIDLAGPEMRQMYIKLKEFSQFFQPGYLGTDPASANRLWYRQKAAMILLTSASVTGIVRDFKRMPAEDRFPFDNFWFPPITDDPMACGPFRGVGGPGMPLCVTNKKNPEHHARVVDFLMFMTTPQNVRLFIDMTLADDQPLTGPLTVRDVPLPPAIGEQMSVFTGHGYEKLTFRGLEDEQESTFEWSVLAQEYMAGRLELDSFLTQYRASMQHAVPRMRAKNGVDGNPKTKDTPPDIEEVRSPWNPFENGSFMLGIILTLFVGFGAWHISRSRGVVRRQTITAYVLLLPTFILLGAFNYFPALSGLYHAFTRWEEGRVAVFNGLDNFKTMMSDVVLWRGIGNMLTLLVAGLFKSIVVPFVAAELVLALISDRLRYLFRTLFLIPMVVPGMVSILIWGFIYDPNMGMLNQALQAMGLDRLQQNWLGEPSLALPSIIFMGFPWVGAFGLLIFMAGLMDIPDSVYESFRMESNNLLKRIFAIDIPLVKSQVRMLIILCFIGSLQDFQTIMILTDGGPGLSTSVPALRMYHEAFRFTHYGYGSAIGLLLFIIVMLLTILNMKVLKRSELEA